MLKRYHRDLTSFFAISNSLLGEHLVEHMNRHFPLYMKQQLAGEFNKAVTYTHKHTRTKAKYVKS